MFDPFPPYLQFALQLRFVVILRSILALPRPRFLFYCADPRVSFPLDPSFLCMTRYAALLQRVSTAIEPGSKMRGAIYRFNKFLSPGSSASRKRVEVAAKSRGIVLAHNREQGMRKRIDVWPVIISDNETRLTDDLLTRVAENDDFNTVPPVHRPFLRVVLTRVC